jgi:hypothetical protein
MASLRPLLISVLFLGVDRGQFSKLIDAQTGFAPAVNGALGLRPIVCAYIIDGTITEYAGNYASTDRGEIWRVFIRPSGWPHLPFRSCETWQVTPETLGHKIRDSHLIVGRAQIERRADCAIKVW